MTPPARRAALTALLLLAALPAAAQSVRLVQSGTDGDHITARLGEVISVDAVVDLGSLRATGLSLFLSLPEGPFQVIDVSAAAGTQPFAVGPLFEGAIVVANDAVPAADVPDVFTGLRLLDFAAVTRVGDNRERSGSGVVATFQLRCIAEVGGAQLSVDVNPVRPSLVTLADGSEATFRGAAGVVVQVAGLDLLDIPDVSLLPGARDSTRIGLLSRYLVNHRAPADSILWTVTGAAPGSLDVDIVGRPRRVRVTHAAGFRGRRTVTFTATEPAAVVPGGTPPTTSETALITVNTPPRFAVRRDSVFLDEDVNTYVVSALSEPNPARALRGRDLDLSVEDPEVEEARRHVAFTYGTATFRAGTDTMRQVRGRVDPVTHELLTWSRPGFSGVDSFRVIVGDEFTLNRAGQDTMRVIVVVRRIPDPPAFRRDEIIALQAGTDLSVALADYVADADTPADSLDLAWTPDVGGRFRLSREGDSLRFTAPELPAQGLFLLTVTDPDGLSDRISQRVRATALPPDSSVTPGLPDFRIEPPLSDVQLTVGPGIDAARLDEHVVSATLTPSQITWSVRGLDDELQVIAAITTGRVLRLRGLSAGADTLVLRGIGPAGRVREDTLVVTVIDDRLERQRLRLLPIPDTDFVAGRGVTLFDLDDSVADRTTHPDSLVSWQARFLGAAPMLLQLRADRTVFVSASDSAVATVVFEATNLLLGVSGRDTVRLAARPVEFGRLPLPLPPMTLAPGGADSLSLDPLLPVVTGASDTAWSVSGQRLSLPVLASSPPHRLRVTAPTDRIGTDTLRVRADLGRGYGAVGTLLVRITELVTPDDFRVLLIPDGAALDYVGVYVVSRRALADIPLVTRAEAGLADVALALSTTGADLARHGVVVWSTTSRLRRPLGGSVTWRATGRTERGTPLDASASLTYARARPAAPLHLQYGEGLSLTLPAGAVDDDQLVLLLPDADPGDPLVEAQVDLVDVRDAPPGRGLSSSRVQGELLWQHGVHLLPADLDLRQPGRLSLGGTASGLGLYVADGDGWRWLSRGRDAPIHRLGTYASLRDTTAPRWEAPLQVAPGRFVAVVVDGGSGVDPASVSLRVDGNERPVGWQDGQVMWQMGSTDGGAVATVLTARDRAGNESSWRATVESAALPSTVELGALYPNPFNPSTTIPVALPADAQVRLDLFDMAGQRLRRLWDGPLAAGHHRLTWDGRDEAGRTAASGVYLVRLRSGDAVRVSRVLLLR